MDVHLSLHVLLHLLCSRILWAAAVIPASPGLFPRALGPPALPAPPRPPLLCGPLPAEPPLPLAPDPHHGGAQQAPRPQPGLVPPAQGRARQSRHLPVGLAPARPQCSPETAALKDSQKRGFSQKHTSRVQTGLWIQVSWKRVQLVPDFPETC